MPLVLSLVVSSMISGILTQKIGYYVPAMILAPSIMAVGEGLMTTWVPSTPTAQWVAYQFLAGFGLGFGMQTSGLAVQTVLPPADISTGIAINFFVQQLGGAVFTSVGQAILSNLLVSELSGIPGLQPNQIINEGATNLSSVVPPEYFDLVIRAYNYACTRIFLASMCLAFGALVCACAMEWRSIKKGKQGPPGGGPPGPKGPAAAPEPSGKSTSSSANLIKSIPDSMPASSATPPPLAPTGDRRLSLERQKDEQKRRSNSMRRSTERRDFVHDQRRSAERADVPFDFKTTNDRVDSSNDPRRSVDRAETTYRPSAEKTIGSADYRRSTDRAAELPPGRSDLPLEYQKSPLDRIEVPREFQLSVERSVHPAIRSADRFEVPAEYRRSMNRVDDWRHSVDHMEMPTNAKSAERLDNPSIRRSMESKRDASSGGRRSMDARRGRDVSMEDRRKSRDMAIQTDAPEDVPSPKKSPSKAHDPNSAEKRQSIDKSDPSASGRRRSTERRKSTDRERRRSVSMDKERRRSVLTKRDRRMSSGSNLGDDSELDLSNQRLPKLYSNRELPPGSTDAVLGVRNHHYDVEA